MPIKNIIFDLEGVLGFYSEVEIFEFYQDSLACIEGLFEGYNLYYLTNVSSKSSSYFNHDVTKIFRDLRFSGGLGSNNYTFKKPDKRFYNELLKKYRIDPNECLFIDDKKANIIAARELGIQAFICTSKGRDLLAQIQEFIKNSYR